MIPCQRDLFEVPRDIAYPNCAYFSPQLRSVTEIGRQSVDRKSRPWEITAADFFEDAVGGHAGLARAGDLGRHRANRRTLARNGLATHTCGAAGEHQVGPGVMVALAVVERTNQRKLVGQPGLPGKHLGDFDARHVGLDHVESGMLKVRVQDEWIWERRLERFEPLVQSVFSARDMPKKTQNARKLRRFTVFRDDDGTVDTCILTGGSLEAPGAKVSPGVLSAISLKAQPEGPGHLLPTD